MEILTARQLLSLSGIVWRFFDTNLGTGSFYSSPEVRVSASSLYWPYIAYYSRNSISALLQNDQSYMTWKTGDSGRITVILKILWIKKNLIKKKNYRGGMCSRKLSSRSAQFRLLNYSIAKPALLRAEALLSPDCIFAYGWVGVGLPLEKSSPTSHVDLPKLNKDLTVLAPKTWVYKGLKNIPFILFR